MGVPLVMAAAETKKIFFISCCPRVFSGILCFVAAFAEVLGRKEHLLHSSASTCQRSARGGVERILHSLPGETEQWYQYSTQEHTHGAEHGDTMQLRFVYVGVIQVSHILALQCAPSPQVQHCLFFRCDAVVSVTLSVLRTSPKANSFCVSGL